MHTRSDVLSRITLCKHRYMHVNLGHMHECVSTSVDGSVDGRVERHKPAHRAVSDKPVVLHKAYLPYNIHLSECKCAYALYWYMH